MKIGSLNRPWVRGLMNPTLLSSPTKMLRLAVLIWKVTADPPAVPGSILRISLRGISCKKRNKIKVHTEKKTDETAFENSELN